MLIIIFIISSLEISLQKWHDSDRDEALLKNVENFITDDKKNNEDLNRDNTTKVLVTFTKRQLNFSGNLMRKESL